LRDSYDILTVYVAFMFFIFLRRSTSAEVMEVLPRWVRFPQKKFSKDSNPNPKPNSKINFNPNPSPSLSVDRVVNDSVGGISMMESAKYCGTLIKFYESTILTA